MLAVQAAHACDRGVGRYSRHLVSALLERDDGHQYFLYAHDALPADCIPDAPQAQIRSLGPEQRRHSSQIDRLARLNPDGLDVLVAVSPFELGAIYHPPARPVDVQGPRLAAVVHDLSPFLFAREDVYDALLVRQYRALEELKQYDALLAVSESTRRDCLQLLGVPEPNVTTIGAACDERFFVPDREGALAPPALAILRGLGINGRFVFSVGGGDTRRNLWSLGAAVAPVSAGDNISRASAMSMERLIDAFALVPEATRRGLQLVVTFTDPPCDREHLQRYATAAGVGDALVVTGQVSDAVLRLLYQCSTAFVFPSLHEGPGLPLLEAMHCGAAVVAGNNSAQAEVVGDAGLLANAIDPNDVAAKLTRLLRDDTLAQSLRARAVVQAGRFRWSETARRTVAVFEALSAHRRPMASRRPSRPRRPRIAFFSPFPPRKSGISDYSALLLEQLKQTYAIDLYHESGYVPEPALVDGGFECCDIRLFPRVAAVRDYHALVYQMGNSRYHHFLYETMLRHPGIVTLHDFCLAGFHLQFGERAGRAREFIAEELGRWYPEHAESIAQVLDMPDWNAGMIARTCAQRGWFLNRGVLRAATRMIVHSPWCLRQLRATAPQEAERVDVIPHGIHTRSVPDAVRAAIRERFDIPGEALMIASFGFVCPEKMSFEALDAFREVARSNPSAIFVFVGEDADGGAVRRRATELGMGQRIRFLGRVALSDFKDLIAVSDVGVNLRSPPTNGETSGSLLSLLAAGVATIVNDVATFSDYPSTTVWRVPWESEGPAGLERALRTLAADRAAREALGRAAQAYTRSYHDWSRVGKLYVDVIERSRIRGVVRTHREPAQSIG
jgi:glycosyltransferase involved in cell wall biosynthesis